MAGGGQDQTYSFTHNAAGQILSRANTHTGYDGPPPPLTSPAYIRNDLNQYTQVGGTNYTYNTRGDLTSNGAISYGYDLHDRLTSAGSTTLAYDAVGRLSETVTAGATTRFLYDGQSLIGEYDASNVWRYLYVHGAGVDEPIVYYLNTGGGGFGRYWLLADERGSVFAHADDSGAVFHVNTFDPYGQPGVNNAGRFQYTGQMWVPEIGLYHYRARAYAPGLGRFLQADPIRYAGGLNLYAYVGGDPINFSDPSGLRAGQCSYCLPDEVQDAVDVRGDPWASRGGRSNFDGTGGIWQGGSTQGGYTETGEEVIVTGTPGSSAQINPPHPLVPFTFPYVTHWVGSQSTREFFVTVYGPEAPIGEEGANPHVMRAHRNRSGQRANSRVDNLRTGRNARAPIIRAGTEVFVKWRIYGGNRWSNTSVFALANGSNQVTIPIGGDIGAWAFEVHVWGVETTLGGTWVNVWDGR